MHRIASAVALAALLAASHALALTLVKDGKAQATIVTGAEPSSTAVEAAALLQTYIERISGARLPLRIEDEAVSGARIYVGKSEAVAQLGIEVPSGHTRWMDEEGFVIRTFQDAIVIAGNEDWNYRGTVFGVNAFLEDLGCRWFFPGEYGEVVPSLPTIQVADIDRRERPSFRIRQVSFGPDARWRDRNNYNDLRFHLSSDGTIINLVPPDTYFESHPEYFATDREGNPSDRMLCLSHPEVFRIGVETIKDYLRRHPESYTYGFAPPDGHPMCYCPECTQRLTGFHGKGYGDPSLSDVWFSFADSVARAVYEEFPDRWIITNGYANRVRPPEMIRELSPNLGIQSTLIASCSFHRIGDPTCWQSRLHEALFDRWTADGRRPVVIYDYDPGKALDGLPAPLLHAIRHDLPYAHRRGAWGYWTDGDNAATVTHLNYYIRAKLMWNIHADVDALVRDYCVEFYGPAAEAVEQYIWTLEGTVETTRIHETWGRLILWREILTPPVMARLDGLLDAAEAAARGSDHQLHVWVLRKAHEHMAAYLEMDSAAVDGEFARAISWVDRMLALREEVKGKVGAAILYETPDFRKRFRTTMEWHRLVYAQLAEQTDGARGDLVIMLPRYWDFAPDPKDEGTVYQWYLPGRNSSWDRIDVTAYWESQGYQDSEGWGYWGKAWYRTSFRVPASAAGKPLHLTVGAVYCKGVWVWVNGVLVEYRPRQDPRMPFDIDVTDAVTAGELNTVAILVNTETPGRNPRGGLHRRCFLWSPGQPPRPGKSSRRRGSGATPG